MNNDFTQRLGSPFPNFSKKNKITLPSLQGSQGTTQGPSGSSSGSGHHNNKGQNTHYSPMRTTSIGIVMEMIHEEDF
jgi:hypothetical protein